MNVVDLDYNITDVNDVLIKVFGLSDKESVLGRKCFEVLKGRKDICPNCVVAEVYQTKAPAYRTSTPEDELEAYHEHIKLINKILRHDIINNLNVINSALRLYGRSKKEELLEEASAHVNKSVELINRMRELEIFSSSHRDLKLYPVTEVLKEVLASYPAITFNIVGEGQVLADESLNSVIDNIISNAVVHGKTDRIDIKIGERGGYCEIRIADYGVGIPEEVKENIFEESFAYGETGGTGLGLYIVKKAMETYGGHVRIEDNTPRGTVFVFALRKVR